MKRRSAVRPEISTAAGIRPFQIRGGAGYGTLDMAHPAAKTLYRPLGCVHRIGDKRLARFQWRNEPFFHAIPEHAGPAHLVQNQQGADLLDLARQLIIADRLDLTDFRYCRM